MTELDLFDARPTQLRITGEYFDSRTEAEWGKYFRTLEVDYEREPEAFVFSEGTFYVPDFYLKDQHTYVEIKKGNLNPDAKLKMWLLARYTGLPGLIIDGRPDNYTLYGYSPTETPDPASPTVLKSSTIMRPKSVMNPEIPRRLLIGRLATSMGGFTDASPAAIEAAEQRRNELLSKPRIFSASY